MGLKKNVLVIIDLLFVSVSCCSCLLVNRIKDQYKVSVRIPPDNEKSNLIRIEGDPQGVKEAKKELLELASRMVREPYLTMSCIRFLIR